MRPIPCCVRGATRKRGGDGRGESGEQREEGREGRLALPEAPNVLLAGRRGFPTAGAREPPRPPSRLLRGTPGAAPSPREATWPCAVGVQTATAPRLERPALAPGPKGAKQTSLPLEAPLRPKTEISYNASP